MGIAATSGLGYVRKMRGGMGVEINPIRPSRGCMEADMQRLGTVLGAVVQADWLGGSNLFLAH